VLGARASSWSPGWLADRVDEDVLKALDAEHDEHLGLPEARRLRPQLRSDRPARLARDATSTLTWSARHATARGRPPRARPPITGELVDGIRGDETTTD
jgi:hypothetical protein